jgi:hypothetical protein
MSMSKFEAPAGRRVIVDTEDAIREPLTGRCCHAWTWQHAEATSWPCQVRPEADLAAASPTTTASRSTSGYARLGVRQPAGSFKAPQSAFVVSATTSGVRHGAVSAADGLLHTFAFGKLDEAQAYSCHGCERRGDTGESAAGGLQTGACRVAGGISAPGSHRSGREPLGSSGSCHLVHQNAGIHAQWANSQGCWLTMRCEQALAFLNGRCRRYFLRSQRIR